MLRPTEEQELIIDSFLGGYDSVIEAGAGTGKSSTLKMLGHADPDSHGLYLVFNRAVADEARATFPHNISCNTAHSIAFRVVGQQYAHRLDGRRVTSKDVAEFLNIRRFFKIPNPLRKDLSTWKIASLAVQTVRRFCQSDQQEIKRWHVPKVNGVPNMEELRSVVLPYAQRVWEDLCKIDGSMPFTPDHYLKMWALGDPVLHCDYLLVDEGQDTNPVLADIVLRQEGIQRIVVGDSRQQLYEWRGARDIMSTFPADERLFLTQSFRFGKEIADEANRWLDYLDAPIRLRGLESIDSIVGPVDDPVAVLCRTNADVVEQALAAQEKDLKVAIVGGTDAILSLAKAAKDLRDEGKTSHPDLSIFKDWPSVLEYVKEEQPDGSFGTFVRLIDSYGTEKVMNVAANCVPEDQAQRVVSTVHKVKGLEWDSVAVDGAIVPQESDKDVQPADLMVAYVAVTRAKRFLDISAVEEFHDRRKSRARVRSRSQPAMGSKAA